MRAPLIVTAALLCGLLPLATSVSSAASASTVTFALTKVSDPLPTRRFEVGLRCADQTAASATLVDPDRPSAQRTHKAAGRTCRITLDSLRIPGRVDEVTVTVSKGADVLARRTFYSRDGQGRSSAFVVPAGDVRVELAVESLPRNEVGTPVRAMAFNIWRSGTLDDRPGGDQNLSELIEFVRSEDPDVLFMVETYGSGQRITDGLNQGRPAGDRYTGVQITREPDQEPRTDNLWLFTKFEVEEIYPREGDGDLTSFNFGGARLRLPGGGHIHAFPTWLHHTDYAWGYANQSALEATLGLPRTYTDEQIVGTDARRRIGMATTLLEKRLPAYVTDDAPVLVAGDFNTLSHQDWTARYAGSAGHGGLALEWPASKKFTEAGFVDTYRWANPDAARHPGRTWSPVTGFGWAPGRIDYVLARGDDVRVLGSYTRTRRLPQHQGSAIDEIYPFYSDHGAVVTDLLIRGSGTGPTRTTDEDDPAPAELQWPEPPAGRAVPAAELTATATSENAGGGEASRAVDGDLRTHWHSRYEPEVDPQPHEITVDLGRSRALSAVRYQPRVVGNMNGTVLRATVQVSADGTTWQDRASVEWDRTTVPKDVDLAGTTARYLRLRVDLGIGGFSSAAEITPYETE